MSPPGYTRRSALRLGALGLLSSVAGCSAANDDETDGTTTSGTATTTTLSETDSPETLAMGETATSEDDVSVTVSNPRVRKIIFSPDEGTITHRYPAGEPNSQFLSVSVTTNSPDISALDLAPVIGDTRRETQAYRESASPGSDGTLSFQVSLVDTESAALEWAPGSGARYRWPVPTSVVETLGRTPDFGVTDFSVPDSIPRGDPFTASLTVENTGDRDGRFLGVVLDEGGSSVPLHAMFTMQVPVGETVSRELSGREIQDDRSSVTALLDWGIEERTATVSISD